MFHIEPGIISTTFALLCTVLVAVLSIIILVYDSYCYNRLLRRLKFGNLVVCTTLLTFASMVEIPLGGLGDIHPFDLVFALLMFCSYTEVALAMLLVSFAQPFWGDDNILMSGISFINNGLIIPLSFYISPWNPAGCFQKLWRKPHSIVIDGQECNIRWPAGSIKLFTANCIFALILSSILLAFEIMLLQGPGTVIQLLTREILLWVGIAYMTVYFFITLVTNTLFFMVTTSVYRPDGDPHKLRFVLNDRIFIR